MTEFCPLNQPQCKRSIMTSTGPFKKQECPISKGRKCAFAPTICPAIYQDKEECYWPKIQEVASQGGCKVKQQLPIISQLCKGREVQQKTAKPGKAEYPPPYCAELPPCTRCSFGRRGSEDPGEAKMKRKKKEGGTRTSVKSEDIKVSASRTPSLLNSDSCERSPRQKKSRKAMTARELGGLAKTEDIKVSTSPDGLLPSQKPACQVTSPETREKIFREAIADKVEKLSKNRESLLVPQCSTASRRAMPCAGCLVDFLSQPPLETQPQTNYVYKSGNALEEERCRLKQILATCPALRVPSMCPKGCFCPDVALMEEEEDDDVNCPFAGVGLKPKAKSSPRCPLTRLPNHPLVLDATRVPDKGDSFNPCKCPLIPNNCCYTLPGCTVHTMRAVIDCPNIKND